MTRNRDSMSVKDMIRVCTLSGAAIMGGMVLLGLAMIAQKPELRLELAQASTLPAAQVPLPGPGTEPSVKVATVGIRPAS